MLLSMALSGDEPQASLVSLLVELPEFLLLVVFPVFGSNSGSPSFFLIKSRVLMILGLGVGMFEENIMEFSRSLYVVSTVLALYLTLGVLPLPPLLMLVITSVLCLAMTGFSILMGFF